ncbi:MAG TPA: transposase [Spirochaetota bacterium]|nr:transposase [Spirochaetota bacterium]HOM11083.1 transposase [Spirochaetota bacterium]HPP51025.1 transposase [Spirochaetota bacterium]
MTLFKNKYRSETTRLKGFDYASPGAYFITICTYNREHVFGKIINGTMMVNETGKIVNECLHDLPNHYPNLKIDEYVIMPDHIHCIMVITEKYTHGIFEFVRALKSFSSRRINEMRKNKFPPIWQSRFYDHIIRNEYELNIIRNYIINNPKKWNNGRNK